MSSLTGKSLNPVMNRRSVIASAAGLGAMSILAGCSSNGGDSGSASGEDAVRLSALRQQIDEIDAQLISMMATRMKVAREIGRVKRDSNMPILQSSRWEDVLGRSVAEGVKQGMSGEFVRRIFEAVHQESIEQQNAVMSEKQ